MSFFCDLHTHSTFSDGSDTPTQIVDAAVELGLGAVALCDHNMVDGLSEFLSAAEDKPLTAIAGAEFSVDYDGKELHLLGLYLPLAYLTQVAERMDAVNKSKEESNIALVESLRRAGYLLDYATLKAASPSGKINRAHIAEALTELGYTASIKEAFRTLLTPEAGHYKAPPRITVWEMLDFLAEIGAVPVLAHPFLDLSEEELEAFLPAAAKRGLAGMEVFYSTFSEEQTQAAVRLARKHGLKPSGGSDYHGKKKPDIFLGIGKGNLKIPYEWAVALRNS